MKKILLSILITCAFISSCNTPNDSFSIDFESVEKIMIENTDSEFGYCDVSQYYLDSYFKTIDGITKAKISVSNDSSNFNEFGIFEFKTDSDAKKSVKNIKTYLLSAKKEFENGIIYDVEEYPKFENAKAERFGNIVSLRSGYISHKWSRATWYIGEYQNGNSSRKVELGISVIDSQTGHSGAFLQPCLFSGRKKHAMLFDDAWYSKHMALTEEGITQAIEAVHMTLNDNAQKLLDTVTITLQNPGLYAKRICEELNKIAKKMSGVLIPGKTVKTFISSVEGLSLIRSNLTVWDVIEILWDLPASTCTGENHKDGMMKTVSRVITLNHSELDAA